MENSPSDDSEEPNRAADRLGPTSGVLVVPLSILGSLYVQRMRLWRCILRRFSTPQQGFRLSDVRLFLGTARHLSGDFQWCIRLMCFSCSCGLVSTTLGPGPLFGGVLVLGRIVQSSSAAMLQISYLFFCVTCHHKAKPKYRYTYTTHMQMCMTYHMCVNTYVCIYICMNYST